MGRRIISSLLAMALIFSLPVFSLADGVEVSIKDSGSPAVSLMALRSIAADDGISLAAAEGNSGQFGYNIGSSFDGDLYFSQRDSFYNYGYSFFLPPGEYSVFVEFNSNFSNFQVWNQSLGSSIVSSSSSSSFSSSFTLDSPSSVFIYGVFLNASIAPSDLLIYDFNLSSIIPVEGISSGYSYSPGVLDKSIRSDFQTLDFSFGSQPAGKYLVNIYHWGDSYDVRFQIYDPTESYFLPVSTTGGVSTFVYNHSGGDLSFHGSFDITNTETSVIDGTVYEYVKNLEADGPLSWSFHINDIVAIPYEQAGDHNFGFFAPIIGFLRDGFASIKSNVVNQFSQLKTQLTSEFTNLKSTITTQFTQLKTLITNQFTRLIDFLNEQYSGAVSSELSQDINSASGMIDQEQQFMENINTQITDQRSNVDPVTVLDGIEGSSNVFSSMLWVSSIVSSGIDGMGVFQFLIYVPMILGVLTLVIGRGASLAGRRPRSQATAVIRVYDRRK